MERPGERDGCALLIIGILDRPGDTIVTSTPGGPECNDFAQTVEGKKNADRERKQPGLPSLLLFPGDFAAFDFWTKQLAEAADPRHGFRGERQPGAVRVFDDKPAAGSAFLDFGNLIPGTSLHLARFGDDQSP